MNNHLITLVIAVLLICIGLSGCTNLESTSENSEEDDNFWNEEDNGFWDDSDEDDGNGQETPSEPKDSDNDGYYDYEDDFPYDKSEWIDSDKDGHGDNSDIFPYDSSEWKDSDYDGYGDNSDVYPTDPSEWADTDEDGWGDNSDPYPYDYDNDGYADSVDMQKNGDAAIKISLEQFNVVDELDFLFTSVEVFFEIYIDGRMEARIDNNGASWSATVGGTYLINDWVVYNINDDQRYTYVTIAMWDDDYLLENDYIDIDGTSNSKILEVVFDAVTGTWSGDDNDGYADGRDDGSGSYDDDDGILWYDIDLVEVEYDKTYQWSYGYKSFSLHVEIPRDKYAYYKHMSVDRSPYPFSGGAHFVTSDDEVIIEIANELNSLGQSQGYDYYEMVNFVLRFVQSLEYTYDNTTTPMNEYWRFSVETLVDETGDCEDTSILFASIMEAMGYDAVLILPTGHAAVGIAGSGYYGTYYSYNGVNYYYCETTGSGYNMGDLPESYKGQSATIVQVG